MDISNNLDTIVYIFNLLGISFPKNDYFEESPKNADEEVGFRKKVTK